MCKISVIVPVYNVEKYISRCIESILNQTFTDFECILVDDGSTDNSGRICDEYEKKDKRVSVIHKQNSGVAAARNTGLDYANGEYITFVDSDDYVDYNFFDVMYNNVDKEADIVVSKATKIYEDGRKEIINSKYNGPIKIKVDSSYSFGEEYSNYVSWGALYRASTIENIRFQSDLYIGEDTLFYNTVLKNSRYIIYVPECLYFYVRRSDSALHSEFSEKNLTEFISWQRMVSLFDDMPEVQKTIYPEYLIRCFNIYLKVCHSSAKNKYYLKMIRKEFRKYIGYIDSFNKNTKVLIIVFAYFPIFYDLYVLLKHRLLRYNKIR